MKPVRQLGRTLIELMISITIGLVIVVAILAVYTSTSSTGRQSESSTRMSEDAAIAMNYMASYVRQAGFSFPQANVPANTALASGGTVEVVDSNFGGAGIRGCDNGFSNIATATTTTALTCNASPSAAGGAIAIRFEGDLLNTSPSTTNPSDCLNNGVATTVASDYAGATNYSLIESRFYVRQGTNSGTPELNCAGNGGGVGTAFVGQPIMQYVESMVLSYGVANDVSSTQVTRYMTSAQVDALGGTVDQRWGRVVSVKICLLMRSEVPDQNGPGTYLDCTGTATVSAGGFLRRAFTSVITLRNRGGISLSS